MKAGKVVSLILVVLAAGCSLLVHVLLLALADRVPWIAGMGPTAHAVVSSLAGAAGIAILIVPCGVLIDRSFARLLRHIEQAGGAEGNNAFGGPRWMRPVSRAMTSVVDQFHQREQSLRNRLRDIEIRHRVSEAERRQVEVVLHALRDAVIVTDAFNEVVMVNEAAARILGFDLEEAIHKPLDQLVPDEHLTRLVGDLRRHGNPSERRRIEHEIARADLDGATAMYEIALSCVTNHKQEVAGVVAILHDLTRERELSQMKSDFVSKASHELRTPLSSIRAYVEMLVDGDAADEASRREFYGIIQNETDRLGRLIDNMLNISRIEAGIIQIERVKVDIGALINRAVSTLEPQAQEKNLSINARLAEIDLGVEGDPDMLYQVVINLVSNAVKYTPEGGRVTVSADSDNLTRTVVVSIADTGLGIPPDDVDRVFDKFYRVENYKRVAKGTGLGLSLCRHIVETVHDGQIGVDSKLGMGSKFWFSVPMRYAGSRVAA